MNSWVRVSAVVAVGLVATVSSVPAMAMGAPPPGDVQSNLNFVWTLVAAALVLMMQSGFLLVEAGLVRSKNSISVAQKNLADLIIAGMAFGGIGYMLMFGETVGGWFGWDGALFAFGELPAWTLAFFVFQVTFCGTSATIVSGAVAERMSYTAYIAASLLIALLIYPVFGHWAWGNLLNADNAAFLADQGFLDFAGSTVVHATGAWVALAGIIVLGPRSGRFDEQGRPRRFIGHNPVLASTGCIILFVGWFGFNGGSTVEGADAIAGILANTFIAAVAGGAVGMVLGRFMDYTIPAEYDYLDEREARPDNAYRRIRLNWQHGYFRPERMINGLLGGLVGITAGCDIVDAHGALLIGIGGGFVATVGTDILERVFKLDDVVGAVSVHGFAGVWGTLALAFFGAPEAMADGSRLTQFLVQAEGAILNFFWAFGLALVAFRLIHASGFMGGMRVPPRHEEEGLNVAEHGTRLGTGEVVHALKSLSEGKADLSMRLDESAGDESGELAVHFNRLMSSLIGGVVNSVRSLRGMADELAGVTRDLSRQSHATAEQAGSVLETTRSMTDSMRVMDEAVSGVGTGATQIHDSARLIAERIEGVSRDTQDVNTALEEARDKATSARSVSQDATSEARATTTAIGELGQAAERISGVLQMVKEIADQTTLLALNATIEAARAGEAGKGFAIVADEVRSLSKQTTRSVEEIAGQVSEIQSGTGRMREAVDRVASVIGQVDQAIDEAVLAIERHGNLSDNVIGGIEVISAEVATVTERIGTVAGAAHDAGEKTQHAITGAQATHASMDMVIEEAEAGIQLSQKLNEAAEQVRDVVQKLEVLFGLGREAEADAALAIATA